MPKLTETYQLAYACCDRVLQETERFPTIDSIRERIGVNSPTTIKKAMNDWTVAFAQKHFEALQRPELPPVLWEATERVWSLAVKQAAQTFQAERQQLDAVGLALQKQAQAEQARADALQTALTEAKTQFDQKDQAIGELQQRYEQLSDETAVLKQRAAEQSLAFEQLKKAHATELEQRKRQQQQEADWAQRRIVEERERAVEQGQAKLSHVEQQLQIQQQATLQTRHTLQQSQAHAQSLQHQCQRLEQALMKAQQDADRPKWKPPVSRHPLKKGR